MADPRPRCPRAQRVPLSVQDLVQMSPSQTDDFTVVFGRKDSTVYAIDRRSGHLLKKFSGSWPSMERAGLGLESQEDVLLLAREDNSVWSIDMRSGQQLWNVSHATLRCLFQGALFPGKAKGGSELSPDPEGPPHLPGVSASHPACRVPRRMTASNSSDRVGCAAAAREGLDG